LFLSFFLSFCCHESLLYNWKHCNLSPHHTYDFNLSHVEMWFQLVSCWDVFGLGVGEGRCPFPIISLIAPGYTVISDTA
jgi:hypothetical protein